MGRLFSFNQINSNLLQTLVLNNEFVYASKNPGVFTDARCYMQWIADQYKMEMPGGYQLPTSCSQSSGRKDDIEKSTCRVQTDHYIQKKRFIPCNEKLQPSMTAEQKNCSEVESFEDECRNQTMSGCFDEVERHVTSGFCDWGQEDEEKEPWDRCRLVAAEGFSYNIYRCKDSFGKIGTCSNNCRGVDPNAIVIGGAAVLAAASAGGLSLLQAAGIGAIGIGAVGAGGASAFMSNRCPNTRPCRVSHQHSCLNQVLTVVVFAGPRSREPQKKEMLQAFWDWAGGKAQMP